jgi:isopentenyl-diphosphate delta-isomerase
MPRSRRSRATSSRKQQHVALTLRENVTFRGKTTGLERLDFIHNALPELNLEDTDPSTTFLGRPLALPFMISGMTGGYEGALTINRRLAEVCEEARIAMGVGSQRQALEDTRFHRTFRVVRDVAPSVPIVGNIGAAEVARLKSADGPKRLVDMIRADGFAVHLNALQELLQPEGTPLFHGVLKGITLLVRELPVPVLVKEIGAGLSAGVVSRLLDTGVRHVDVAGAGGTSWAGVELLRRGKRSGFDAFWDWGIPTAEALRGVASLRSQERLFTLIASGGITTGLEAAKCIALGADLVGSARPMLSALQAEGRRGLRELLAAWDAELRAAMFLTGSHTLHDLQRAPLVERPIP